MNETKLPSSAIRNNEAGYYQLLLHVAQGDSIKAAAAREDATVSASHYYLVAREHPEWMEAIRTRAQADAIALIKQKQSQNQALALQTEAEVQAVLLQRALSVVEATLVAAEAGSDKHAKLVQQWTQTGYALEREGTAPQLPGEPTGLAYDPHVTGPAQLLKLSVPQGTEVTVKTPDSLLDLPSSPQPEQ